MFKHCKIWRQIICSAFTSHIRISTICAAIKIMIVDWKYLTKIKKSRKKQKRCTLICRNLVKHGIYLFNCWIENYSQNIKFLTIECTEIVIMKYSYIYQKIVCESFIQYYFCTSCPASVNWIDLVLILDLLLRNFKFPQSVQTKYTIVHKCCIRLSSFLSLKLS